MHDIVGASVPERGCYPGLGSVPHCCVTKERPAERKGETSLAASSHDTPLIRKLESIFPLSEDERSALESLPIQVANLGPDQDIVRIGDRPLRCFLIQDGFTCSYKITGEGTRQILNFHIAGDIPDLQSLHLSVLDHSISTITPCTVGFIPHEGLHDLCGRYYRITSALRRETLIDAAVFREWIVNNGRREACPAMAHL